MGLPRPVRLARGYQLSIAKASVWNHPILNCFQRRRLTLVQPRPEGGLRERAVVQVQNGTGAAFHGQQQPSAQYTDYDPQYRSSYPPMHITARGTSAIPNQYQQQPQQHQPYSQPSPIQPMPQQHHHQAAAYAGPVSAPQLQSPSAIQAGPALPGPGTVPRVNPGKAYVNSVVLLGTVVQPQARGARTCQAFLQVPFAQKAGYQQFILEAWDEVASSLQYLHGAQVVVEGRLSQDRTGNNVIVVPYRIKLVDTSLPVDELSPTKGASGTKRKELSGSKERQPRSFTNSQELFRTHYETQTQSVKALAAHFGKRPQSILDDLLLYAFKTGSPLRWRALAEEAGLGLAGSADALTFEDFIAVIDDYKAKKQQAEAADPGSGMPVTKEGMLRVRPIRDWALSLDKREMAYFTVTTYEKQHGLEQTYNVLRMAAVAEATKGAWDYNTEFSIGG